MPDNDRDDLNTENLTETKAQRAPVLDPSEAPPPAPVSGTRWPAVSGIASVGALILFGFAAWKLAARAARDLFGPDSTNEPR